MARIPFRPRKGDTQLPEKVRQVVETLPYGRIGIYILKDSQGKALRIGHSKDLRHRIADYFRVGATGWPGQVDSVEVILTDSEESARSLEKQLINEHRPPHNDLHNPDERPIDPIRAQLIEARRNQILEAAARVFAEKGFHRATTREIASAAGVSEGTIYNYFTSKEDLLIGMITRLAEIRELPEELAGALKENPQGFFTRLFRHRIERIQDNYQVLQAILPEILINPELRERFYEQFIQPTASLLEQYVQARVQMGDIRPLDVPLVVRVVQSTFVGLLVLRILGDEVVRSAWDEMPDILPVIVFEGLSPKHGG